MIDFIESHQALPDPPWMQRDDEYRGLADHIIGAINPPDSDGAEISILIAALDRLVEFAQVQPCTCPSGALHGEGDPCARCGALGRAEDVRTEW